NNELHMETWNTSQQMDGVDPMDHKITDFLDIVKPYQECTPVGGDTPDEDVTDDGEVSDADSAVETPDETNDTVDIVDETADNDTVAVDDTPAKTDADQTATDDTNIPQTTASEGCTVLTI
ncbi:hypothetical protein KAH37_07190, partial [bacterium]|nr:hypothetical protein [bacterium]